MQMLDDLIARLQANVDSGLPDQSDQPMKIQFYENVHMDWCTDHGVFLDAGELEAILNNLRMDPLYVRKVALRLWERRF